MAFFPAAQGASHTAPGESRTAPGASRMSGLLEELKVRARIAVNASRREGAQDARLRHSLNEAARQVGFATWAHARAVLGGEAGPGDDVGTFWHAPRTGILLNQWLAQYGQARLIHAQDTGTYLLPYKRQFVLVQAPFIAELGVDPQDTAWDDISRDLVAGYASPAWMRLARQRMAAPRESFERARP